MIDLRVHGTPRGKGRPRFVKATGRTYTDAQTTEAEGDIIGAWERAGAPRVDGPVALHVTAVLERPKGHRKRNGDLSAEGLRHHWPAKKPDLDNLVKLVMDALNTRAYRDDCQVVHSVLWKRWASPGEVAHTRVWLEPMRLAR